MDKNILICGHRSFVAAGLYKKLVEAGYQVDCFSRGKEGRDGNKVAGDVFEMTSNRFLSSAYDIVINFILIKNESVKKNMAYIKELVDFCEERSVNRFIHISSLMVYDNNEPLVNENTAIEENTNKEGYGKLKIKVDQYLKMITDPPFQLTFVRPGYVLDEERPIPFMLKLPFGFTLIKGNKNSKQHVVKLEDVHQGLINIIKFNPDQQVYLFVPSDNTTKYHFVKKRFNYRHIILPRWLILGVANLFLKMGLIRNAFYKRVEGMYIETFYDSTKTENLINVRF